MSVSGSASRPVIEVVGASKSFILKRERSTALRESLSVGRLKRGFGGGSEEFWAVKDVSFTVSPGQSVGIVGHNGSGKSTMLKMLTGILKPTRGTVAVHGRIGALIEVGAGFHPDLSGRENIFLNGSILGLSRREIDGKFDEIVSFAGLEKFIDTPVKRYSSGMYMRLGMAIAFHTDPNVLLIDEVLAVGDTQFQRKCVRRLADFVAQGGAAIFVSHSMGQVAEICQTCVWMDQGVARYIGPSETAIEQYMAVVVEREDEEFKRNHPEEWAAKQEELRLLEETERREREEAERLEREAREEAERIERETREEEEQRLREAQEREERLRRAEHERQLRAQREAEERLQAEEAARVAEERRQREIWLADYSRPRILGITILGDDGRPQTRFTVGSRLEVRIAYQFIERPVRPNIALEFYREDGLYCFGTSNDDHRLSYADIALRGEVVMKVDFLALNAGEYRIRLRLWTDTTRASWAQTPEDVIDDAARITVETGPFAHGCLYLPVHWFPSVSAASHDELTSGEMPLWKSERAEPVGSGTF